MAEGVVDLLEVIDVEHQHGEGLGGLDGLRDAFDPYSRAAGSVKDQEEDDSSKDDAQLDNFEGSIVSEETTERA